MKLFEIPIYAVSKEVLLNKFKEKKQKLREKHSGVSKDSFRAGVENETYPQRLWEYNHIVGYISVSYQAGDILFNVYLPTPQIKRYYWTSSRKVYLYDISANGLHFRILENMDNSDIARKNAEIVNSIIQGHIPKRYYVDTEAFNVMNAVVDYRMIMRGETNEKNKI